VDDQPRDDRGLPVRRDAIVDRHAQLSEQHELLRDRGSALLEHREHRDELIEHRDAIARFHRDLQPLTPTQRERLELGRIAGETEDMLTETLAAIERAREAWKRATDAWQRVREKLDR
jgi:hypothetical protein